MREFNAIEYFFVNLFLFSLTNNEEAIRFFENKYPARSKDVGMWPTRLNVQNFFVVILKDIAAFWSPTSFKLLNFH